MAADVAFVIEIQRQKILGPQSLLEFNTSWMQSDSGKTLSGVEAAASVQNLLSMASPHQVQGKSDAIAIVLGQDWETKKDERTETLKEWIMQACSSKGTPKSDSMSFPIRVYRPARCNSPYLQHPHCIFSQQPHQTSGQKSSRRSEVKL